MNFSGIYHLVGKNKISKYELLVLIKEIWGLKNVEIRKVNNQKIDRSLVDSNKLILSNNYPSMFKELYAFMNNNKALYDKYYLSS